ncbi:hypothetical protein [Wenzhouxiangella marina]|uniref:Uncharacterized protein n=1 Tax=Wenzhouxiangella marina TaxID=1579979 RepID=A0A0K0XZB9_9GAMM|nr:hypothetical protein [Wenzhouxiangella marina]AKS43029.1 hypothetical protein WM2015_2671 [Wenzhouxiangella marina]MBB6087288.1 hypothetical protein [Wenzhouxiangella marina]
MSKKMDRRSFLSRLGATAGIGALSVITGTSIVRAQATDSDTGRNADPVGGGRGNACTDSDTGSNADQVGRGRCSSYAGGGTDSDTGNNADPVGGGRGTTDRAGRGRNCSDSDGGSKSDPGGSGRSCTDSD